MEPILEKMGKDHDFLRAVVQRNLNDKGWLEFNWSDYNIPFFYVHETDDFIIKIHLETKLIAYLFQKLRLPVTDFYNKNTPFYIY